MLLAYHDLTGSFLFLAVNKITIANKTTDDFACIEMTSSSNCTFKNF